jgi:hypothetical protein
MNGQCPEGVAVMGGAHFKPTASATTTPRSKKRFGGAAGPKLHGEAVQHHGLRSTNIRALKMAAQAPTAELGQLSGMGCQRINT